jgi:Carboxypeptidase regulatory-like domain
MIDNRGLSLASFPVRPLRNTFLLKAGFCLFLLAWMTLFTLQTYGQSTFGSIRGTVQDDSGAVIPNTVVTIHSLDESFEREVTTSDSGDFLAENLKAGHYQITAHHDGFADAIVNSVALDARQDLRIPMTLSVAAKPTVVEVSAGADQINTENGTLSDSKDNRQITQLPLNNRATTTSPLGSLTLRQYRHRRSELLHGELLRRWHLDGERTPERCIARRVSLSGGYIGRKSDCL